MRTALYEPTLSTVAEHQDEEAWRTPGPVPAGAAPRWRSQSFAEPSGRRAGRQRATRYERFTTRMVLVSSVIMLGVTACLHVINYDLETKTSSTSGTHGDFYKESD